MNFLGVVIVIFVIVLSIISQVTEAIKKAAEAQKKNVPNRPRVNDDVQQEIERFVNQTKQGNKPAGNPSHLDTTRQQFELPQQGSDRSDMPSRDMQETQSRGRQQERGKRNRNSGQQSSRQQNAPAGNAKDEGRSKPKRRRIQEEVQEHINTTGFDKRSANLTHVKENVEQLQQHVHQQFDHQLGQLSTTVAGTQTSASHQSTGVRLRLLDIRNAVIMNEILTRPEERWENLDKKFEL